MYIVCRVFWHKTRRRALRELRQHFARAGVVSQYAAMCGLPDPTFAPEPCDWKIANASAEHFREMILEENTGYMEILVGDILKENPELDKDFFAACAPLGRDARCRDFMLNATRIHRLWEAERENEMSFCPFTPELDAQARAFFPDVLEFLLEWSLPRFEAIEQAYRERILSDERCMNLCFYAMFKNLEPLFNRRVRYGPPLPQLLPAVACLRIQRHIEQYQQNIANCAGNAEQQEAYGDTLGTAIYEILDQYREILRAHDLTKRAVTLDIYYMDMPKGPEAILGKYASFARLPNP